ncbi:MAG: Para-aminobenzoate/anthranilate synthase glutamine amidotransferasecomponent II, anthranilate synthase component II [Candidatus Peregrinibacteria bacterium GW2011_GWF2_39_17]|nr:MAG: Para-aminobenzoate/anthranilate synthase glutamine amidotransferasecomponent II, anthranilate synthase component II [Candidatus Peregrinibacteria bacterium GW2011_GWF2_39_17]HCW32809.1 aminodeoxychorismate/anthranilate synthase component II [Candidatus Peregrinibacteria bacterium]
MKTLILDNYDSFTYNLYQYIGELGGNPIVKRNDEISLEKIKALKPTHLVISPGPGTPENPTDFGICSQAILKLGKLIPLLGVCLGHQGIIYLFGGKIVSSPEIMHGKTSEVHHDRKGIFHGLKNPLTVMRYHSLMGDPNSIPDCLTVTARTTKDKIIMGIRHNKYPIEGIQFHPESIGTPTGKQMIANFLKQAT